MEKKSIKVYSGREYREFEILPRKEIENIILDLILEDIVEEAEKGHIPGYKTGYAIVDLQTGKLAHDSLSQNEIQHPWEAVYAVLYSIDQNHSLSDFAYGEDILGEEENTEYESMLENGEIDDIQEYAAKKNIDLSQRYIQALACYAEDIDFLEEANLDEWYDNED